MSKPTTQPDWRPLIDSYLAPYRDGIATAQIDRAEQWAASTSGYSSPGSWRAKLVNGTLWVKPIHLHFEWMERASVLRALLLALRSVATPLPDLDFVYVSADVDPTPRRRRRRRCLSRSAKCALPTAPMPVMTNARARHGSEALPLPEFSWLGQKSHTKPWCQLHPTLARAAAARPWQSRDVRGYFSGSLSTGVSRQELRRLGSLNPSAIEVRDTGFEASGEVSRQERDRANRTAQAAGLLSQTLDPAHACSFRHLLSIPGFGYASRLRQLLACGSVVVHVEHDSEEFYSPLLLNGTHLLRLPGGGGTGGGRLATQSVKERLLPMLRQLRADQRLTRVCICMRTHVCICMRTRGSHVYAYASSYVHASAHVHALNALAETCALCVAQVRTSRRALESRAPRPSLLAVGSHGVLCWSTRPPCCAGR